MKEGAKRHLPMFYTFDFFFTLLDLLSYEHRRDGENPDRVFSHLVENMVTASIVSLL